MKRRLLKNSDKARKVWETIAFLVIFCILFQGVNALFMDKYSYIKYKEFYQQEENIDVLFLGTSRVLNGVDPMELWHDWGVASYNLANFSETISVNYWQLVNALQYTKPKVVVLDLFASHETYIVNDALLHHFTDAMPMSLTKIRAVTDLEDKAAWPEYLFAFSLYHSRWNGELTMQDVRPVLWKMRGGGIRYHVVPNEPPTLVAKDQYNAMEGAHLEYLQKIIGLCKEEGIQLVLTYIPYTSDETAQKNANYGYVVAEENHIPYLDILREGVAFNFTTDWADEGGHLSALGARKVTDYLGEYLVEMCGVPDRRDDAAYAYWDEDYLNYMSYKISMMNEQDNLMFYLVLLSDRNLETTVCLGADSMALEDRYIAELLNGIGIFGTVKYCVEDHYGQNEIGIQVVDNNSGNVVSRKYFVRSEENVWEEIIP